MPDRPQSEPRPNDSSDLSGTFELHRRLVERLPHAVSVWHQDDPADPGSFRFLFLNSAAERVANVSFEFLQGKTIREAFPDFMETEGPSKYVEAIESGRVQELPNFKYGDAVVPEATYSVRLVPLGARNIAVIFQNVTELKAAVAASRRTTQELEKTVGDRTEELREERNMLRTLIDSMPDLIYFKDTGGRLLVANKAMAPHMGVRTREDLIGKTDFDFHPPEMAERYRRAEKEILRTGKPFVNVEEPVVDNDGEMHWMSTTKMPLHDDQGNAIGLVGIGRDITAEKDARETLLQQEEEYYDLYENAPIAYYTVGLDGRLIRANRSCTELTGYTAVELIGRHLLDLYTDTPSGKTKARLLFQGILIGKDVHDEELQILRPDGTTRWVSLTVRPIRDAAGDIVSTRSMAVDVTERKRLEDQLRQSQKMEAVGELTAGIAHNFNNMLQAIRGNLDLVVKYQGEDAAELLSDASHAASRAAEMVQQLMVFSRQGLQPEHGAVKLQQIAKETVEICRKAFDRKIHIAIESIGDPTPILGDSGQLSQIMMNLCINARDAFEGVVDRHHQIRVEVEEPSNHIRPPLNNLPTHQGSYVRLRIIDNGTGMDEETRKRVFDPFFTTKEVDEGTGLGLSTVYGITQQHGGWVTCDTKLGEGTTFSVFLPTTTQGIGGDDKDSKADGPRGTETILVIEDEAMVRKVTGRMLENSGYRVLEAVDGMEGMAIFKEQRESISLLLLDLSMPGMSGREVLAEVRRIDPRVPVLILTGYSVMDEDNIRPEMVVQKPFDQNDLAHKVRAALEA
jgi:two-component system cell cycle sensor histidine kinase/response regulator CckA